MSSIFPYVKDDVRLSKCLDGIVSRLQNPQTSLPFYEGFFRAAYERARVSVLAFGKAVPRVWDRLHMHTTNNDWPLMLPRALEPITRASDAQVVHACGMLQGLLQEVGAKQGVPTTLQPNMQPLPPPEGADPFSSDSFLQVACALLFDDVSTQCRDRTALLIFQQIERNLRQFEAGHDLCLVKSVRLSAQDKLGALPFTYMAMQALSTATGVLFLVAAPSPEEQPAAECFPCAPRDRQLHPIQFKHGKLFPVGSITHADSYKGIVFMTLLGHEFLYPAVFDAAAIADCHPKVKQLLQQYKITNIGLTQEDRISLKDIFSKFLCDISPPANILSSAYSHLGFSFSYTRC